ncbi:MAG: hypothetical protein JXA72_04550 [Bacteroidales bacterium]|nr:hypothetical protein [Bacteroidales bacterium]
MILKKKEISDFYQGGGKIEPRSKNQDRRSSSCSGSGGCSYENYAQLGIQLPQASAGGT